jgi:uncharacterized protein (DUF1499 family)
VAKIAGWLAVITVAAILIGTLGAMTGVVPPLQGFLLFAAAMVLGSILTLIVGVIGLIVTRARDGQPTRPGRVSARAATGIGLGLLVVLAVLASRSGGVPAIHDITTDPNDPPQFVAAAQAPGNQGRNLTYPHGRPDSAALQQEAYPDLQPIGVDLSPGDALQRARQAAQDLGWEVVDEDAGAGRLEATYTSRIFRFVDDIVVRIRPSQSGSIVDLRSTSRVGESDLGANAARIRAFRERLTVGE